MKKVIKNDHFDLPDWKDDEIYTVKSAKARRKLKMYRCIDKVLSFFNLERKSKSNNRLPKPDEKNRHY